MSDEISETNTKAEIAQDILLVPNRMRLCEQVFQRIRREWADEPYAPTVARFSTTPGAVGPDLQVEIEFDAYHKVEDAEPFRRELHLTWSVANDMAPGAFRAAIQEVWDGFLLHNTHALRRHFALAIGTSIVMEERMAEIAAREIQARAKSESA